MRRFNDYLRAHPSASGALSLAGLVTMLIGASGYPANIADWGEAFAAIGGELGRWVLAAVGFGLVVVPQLLQRKEGRRVPPAPAQLDPSEVRKVPPGAIWASQVRERAKALPRGPQLSFGRADLPTRSQMIVVGGPAVARSAGWGRVIRVPVTNAHGAGEAIQVHARLRFLPDRKPGDRMFAPDETQGEWAPSGEVEINLPGNGRPRLLDVALVLDAPYPNIYEWTSRSRAAYLDGYEIKAQPIEVEIEVLGSGAGASAPRLMDTLRIDCREGQLVADWASAGADEPTNWVARAAERPDPFDRAREMERDWQEKQAQADEDEEASS